jgi:hypothetical protein
MPFAGSRLSDKVVVVEALAPQTPSSATPNYLNLKLVKGCQVVISVKNSTTVTGAAITLNQAKDTSGTSAKALAFSNVLVNADTATNGGPSWTNTAVSSNTFTTTSTNSKNATYVIDVDNGSLDKNNGFYCLQVGVANAVNTAISVMYVVEPDYGGNYAAVPKLTS